MAYAPVRFLRASVLYSCFGLLTLVSSRQVGFASGTITNCTEAALRAALVGGGSVQLACNDTISLQTPFVISKATVLDGTGHTPVLSSTVTNTPMFLVQPGASLTLRGITLSGSKLTGVNGTNGQSGQSGLGAAIYNQQGTVTLESCVLSNNVVTGGIGSDAVTAAARGGDGGDGAGGAIYNSGGLLYITNCTFAANRATGGTGGDGAANRIVGANGASGGPGGDGGRGVGAAVYNGNQGFVHISNSFFMSNVATGAGGGAGGAASGLLGLPGQNGSSGSGIGASLFSESGTVWIVSSTFLNNVGVGATGADGVAGTTMRNGSEGSRGGAAQGSAVFAAGGTVSLTNCTLAANLVRGGAGGAGGSAQTFGFGSQGAAGGPGGDASGAAVFTGSSGVTLIVNCTFSDNGATPGQGGPGGAASGTFGAGAQGASGQASGGAIFNEGGSVQLKNTIVAHSQGAANVGGSVLDQGYNLSSDVTPAFQGLGSRNNVDPLLGALTSTTTAAATLTLATNSPAVDAITAADANGSPSMDQQQLYRVAPYDIGAYEVNARTTPSGLQSEWRDNTLVLSWPTVAGTLETTTDLSAGGVWAPVPLQSSDSVIQTLSISPTNQASYFRLSPP